MKLTKFKMTIKRRMVLLVLIALIPLILLQLIGIMSQYSERIEEELKSSLSIAQTVELTFMNYLEENWSQQYAIGMAIIANPEWKREDIDKYINNVLSGKQNLKRYSWISPDGIVLASSNDEIVNVNARGMEFYIRILNGEQKIVSNLREDIINDSNLILHIARGIYADGELKGIMLGILDVEALSEILNIQYTGRSVKYGLIDKAGMLVHRHKEHNIPLSERKIETKSPLFSAFSEKKVKFNYPSQFDSTNRLGAATLIEDIGWISYYSISSAEVLSSLMRYARRDIAVLFLTSLFSILIALFVGNKYTSSLERLKDAADEISKGNLSFETNFTGSDEISATSEAFNRMTREINNQISQRDEVVMLKTNFFSTVSHELKTPINIILGAVQLMDKMEDISKTSIQKYIKMQKQNSYRLLRLINNLIDINKIENNQFKIKPVNYDIVSLVEDITTSVVEYTELKNIEIVFDTEVEEKIMAVDPDKIERIILNLLSNSIKFTDSGGKIEVTIYDKDDKVQISVKDTGIGIPEHMQESIFQYFTQVDDSLHRKAEGSGIGLSLVKSLVDMHGGNVRVKSTVGEGSEFVIELPVILLDNPSDTIEHTSFTNVERINIEFSDIYLKVEKTPES